MTRPASPPRTALRDLRDALGAGLLTLGFFGTPVTLAALGQPGQHQVSTEPTAERSVAWAATLAIPVSGEPAPALQEAALQDGALQDGALQEADLQEADLQEAAQEAPPLDAAAEEEAAGERDPQPPEATGDRLGRRRPPSLSKRGPAAERLSRGGRARQAAAERARKQERTRSCEEGTGAIAALGGDRYTVERGLIDLYIGDLERAQGLASVAWHRDAGGRIDGFRIKRIRCGTVLYQAGFRDGDVVHSLNGQRIRTVLGAIGAYSKLKRKEELRVELTRGDGSQRRLRYTVL